ncbi:MAG: carbohydrate ABC transporter permease [Eubacteriales bacterium]|nr:carbohydrate ABC transporter permease [Eubacteriales bacterium]
MRKKAAIESLSPAERLGHAAVTAVKYFSLLLAAFIALLPLISCLLVSFKADEKYQLTPVMQLPENFLHLDNFRRVWVEGDMGRAFATSFFVVVVVVVFSVLMGSMLAYALNRFRFPGNGLIRNLFLFATLIPGIAMQVTIYQIMSSMKLVNSLLGYIILQCGTDVISICIFLQYFVNLSVSLDESAILDGCTYFGVFFKILFPLLHPAIVTVMILKGIGVYNEYYAANLYLQDKTRFVTASTALYTFTGPFGNAYNLICAGVILTLVPMLVIFIACQQQIYSGLAAGAVKG